MKTVQLVTITALAAVLVMALSVSATTVTRNAVADTYLRGTDQKDQGFGAANPILVGQHASVGPFHGLLRFDLTALTDPQIRVTNATLTCTSGTAGIGNPVTINVFNLTQDNTNWFEGTQSGVNAVGGASCWNFKARYEGGATSTNWPGSVGASTAGTDYDSASLASWTGNAGGLSDGAAIPFVSQTAFTNAVQNALGSYLNIGMANDVTAVGNGLFIRVKTREGSATATSLVIDYYVIPEPATLTLLGAALLMLRRRIC